MATEREERNRQRLVESARFLFFAEGFSSLGMERIAERLGVSKATLYKYFPDKRALVAAVVDLQMEEIGARLEDLNKPGRTFPERFAGLLGTIFETIGPSMRRFVPDILRDAPWEWERIAEFRRKRVFSLLQDLLDQGGRHGMVRADIPATSLAPLLIAVIEQFGRPEVLAGLPVSMEQTVRSFAGILLQGILSEGGRKEFGRISSKVHRTPRPSGGAEGREPI
ncbi:MAG: TetR/AcrR family transcriptional regulator [Treponema sp.]|nr:TetR/AcrR family transcriptional regulator [Treponema sp.]